MENSQVRWLARDDDVAALLQRVIGPHRAELEKSLVDRWLYLMTRIGYMDYGPAPSEADVAAAS